MDEKTKIKKIDNFIKDHNLAVISTVSRVFLPESAVIGISQKENLELIFGTFRSSRKFENIQSNPRVALVIGWEKGKTVQYEGTAEELSGKELEEAVKIHLAKMPSAAKYVSAAEQVWLKVKPNWIKYSDLSSDPWETIEVKF